MTSEFVPAQADGVGRSSIPGIFSTLMQLSSDAIIVFDGARRIISCNAQAEALSEFPAQKLIGSDIGELLFDAQHVPGVGEVSEPEFRQDVESLPFQADGSRAEVSLRLASGGSLLVGARCDRVSAPGATFLLVMRAADADDAAAREHDRLVEELSLANRRLSGTLRIVLDTIDAENLDILFSEVLELISDTLDASGVLIYLAQTDGFRLKGATESLSSRRLPQFMAYGEGLETLVTRAGSSLRLHLVAPSEMSLRAGALQYRELFDEDDHVQRRIPARQVPPFTSFICVPVWFGGHVIAVIEVGWADARPVRRDDARLLDSVAQYLSVELAAALSSMRAEREQRLEAARTRLHAHIENDPQASITQDLQAAADAICAELDVQLAPLVMLSHQTTCVANLPDVGEVDVPFNLDELVEGCIDGGVAVVPIKRTSELALWLIDNGFPATGALLDLGELGGERRACFVLRTLDKEPLDDTELDFLRSVVVDVHETAQAGERREKDTRISQALQNGMRNELQQVEGISGAGLYSSATDAACVGGDFYDLIRLPGHRACIILGDVSGKGVEAASVSAAVKTALGAYAWENQPPARMVRLLNDFLLGFSRLETFATMFVGMIDLTHGTLTYCSAGHPPALLLRANTREMETLDVQSGVVGAFKAISYRDGRVVLHDGDALLLYTDGVTEARNPSGAFFGEDGLHDALMEEAARGFDHILDRLLERIDAFTQRNLDDDVAMVALRFDAVGHQTTQKKQAQETT